MHCLRHACARALRLTIDVGARHTSHTRARMWDWSERRDVLVASKGRGEERVARAEFEPLRAYVLVRGSLGLMGV